MRKSLLWTFAATAIYSFGVCYSQQPSQDLVKPWERILGIRTLAFSPDGRLLAGGVGYGENTGGVVIWDAKTLKVHLARSVEKGVSSVAFSADSKTLAIGTYSENCYLLDAETGNIKATLSGHGAAARAVAFAADGKALAIGSFDHDVHLWDWRAGERLRTLKGHIDQVYLVAFSPDAKTLASCGRETCLWETATGKLLHKWESGRVAFDPKGKWLATVGNDSSVSLRDLQDFKKTWAFYDGIYAYRFLAIHPSGKSFAAFTGFGDADLRIFPLELGQASAADEKRIAELMALWSDDRIDVREKASQDLARMGGMTKPLLRKAIKESPSAEVRVRAREVLKVLGSPKPLAELRGHHEAVVSCAYSPDGQLLATGARDGLVLLWDISTYRRKATLTWPQKKP